MTNSHFNVVVDSIRTKMDAYVRYLMRNDTQKVFYYDFSFGIQNKFHNDAYLTLYLKVSLNSKTYYYKAHDFSIAYSRSVTEGVEQAKELFAKMVEDDWNIILINALASADTTITVNPITHEPETVKSVGERLQKRFEEIQSKLFNWIKDDK